MAPERTKAFQVRMSEEEFVMLTALAHEDAVSASDAVRLVVRREFERRFDEKRPSMQTSIRALLDETAKELKDQRIAAQVNAFPRRRRDYDRRKTVSPTVLASERRAYQSVCAAKESASPRDLEKALHALEELEVDYVNAL
jgi:hypothetical protein